jgi:hypothetical protein
MNVEGFLHGLIFKQLDREMAGDDVVRTARIEHSVQFVVVGVRV